MKKLKNILVAGIGLLIVASCNKTIEKKQLDPNDPTSVPPNLIMGTILTDISGTGGGGRLSSATSSEGQNAWDGSQRWNQYHCSNYDYYDNNIYAWTNGSFSPYLVLKNVIKMDSEATATGGPQLNAFEAIGRFVTAYYLYNMTSFFGDIPQAQALQGVLNQMPAYTTQAEVFKYVLSELDTANTHLATLIAAQDFALSKTQDIYYNGDLTKWQKCVNSFKLRVLVALSKQSGDATLNVPAEFAKVFGDPATYPVFTSQDDDMKFVYVSQTYSTYPFNPTNYGSIAARFNMANTYVSNAVALSDPRVFVTSEPASALLGSDPNPAQYKFFKGASTGESVATMYNNANAGKYSFINRARYYSTFTGEPQVIVGYKELCFNIAEAITRGWATGSAETWYKTGITESMAFYGIDITQTAHKATFQVPNGSSPTDTAQYPYTFVFANYYAQDSVKLSATPAIAINQIVKQKYLASFENSGYESYYNWRRTGVPTFDDGVGVGNNGNVPVRWAYPVTEQVQNTANWQAALSAQGYSADDLNQKMWLIK